MTTDNSGMDLELADGRWIHAEFEVDYETGDDYEPGDWTTPPSGGPFVEINAVRITAVDRYDDGGYITARLEGAALPAEGPVAEWCPSTLDEVRRMVQAEVEREAGCA